MLQRRKNLPLLSFIKLLVLFFVFQSIDFTFAKSNSVNRSRQAPGLAECERMVLEEKIDRIEDMYNLELDPASLRLKSYRIDKFYHLYTFSLIVVEGNYLYSYGDEFEIRAAYQIGSPASNCR